MTNQTILVVLVYVVQFYFLRRCGLNYVTFTWSLDINFVFFLLCQGFFFFSSVYFLPSFKDWVHILYHFPGGSDGKESAYQCRRPRFNPWVRKIPWRRKWQPTPVFLPRKSHGHRSLVGYSLWGHKELDTTLYSIPCY